MTSFAVWAIYGLVDHTGDKPYTINHTGPYGVWRMVRKPGGYQQSLPEAGQGKEIIAPYIVKYCVSSLALRSRLVAAVECLVSNTCIAWVSI